MAKLLEIEYSGVAYHVTSRGNACARIYLVDYDYVRFLILVLKRKKRKNYSQPSAKVLRN